MDNLTHSLVGAILGQAGLKRRTGLGMPALIVGANIPDADAIYALGGVAASLEMHRGIAHGPLALLLFPPMLAGLFILFDRWQKNRGTRPAGRPPVRFGWLCILLFLGCATHIGLDWSNSHGVRLLEPFSDRWFHGDLLFIVDIWLWLGFGVALYYSCRLERLERRGGAWRRPARVAIGVALAYLGVNGLITHAREQAFVSPPGTIVIADEVPVAFWRREMISGKGDGLWTADNRRYGDVPLARCDLAKARAIDPRVGAYLFWSRAPFVWRDEAGWMLGDARYAGELAEVVVALPENICPPGR